MVISGPTGQKEQTEVITAKTQSNDELFCTKELVLVASI